MGFGRRWAICSCALALVALGAFPGFADATPMSVTCPRVDRFEALLLDVSSELTQRVARKSACTLTRVPLDYSGRTPGTIDLFVQRVPAATTSRGAIVALAGGPGQGASSITLEYAAALGPVLRDHELIIFDQRGTGRSGPLECSTLEKEHIGPLGPAVQACAEALGAKRSLYTTFDSVDDLDRVRRDLGLEKLTLFGTSYGTKVALAYAQAYPDSVDRLLLDSVVALDGPDPFNRDVFKALPRVLQALCANGACRAATPDPVGDLAALVRRLAREPLRGYVVGGDGKRRARRLGRLQLLRILIEGDTDPTVRAEFPASVRAALRGDEAPLLRLAHRAGGGGGGGGVPDPRAVFSPALFVATACEEGPWPWELVDPFSKRWGRAISRAGAIPDASFYPFDRATGRASDVLRLCAHWPANGPARQPSDKPLPDVPTLLLSGEADLRTPAEEAKQVSALLPRATALTVPFAGHGVLLDDFSCATRAVRRFFIDQPIALTCQGRPSIGDLITQVFSAPTPLPPVSLSRVPRAHGVPGPAGRTLTAVELTFVDAFRQLLYSVSNLLPGTFPRIGGLRGGRLWKQDLDRYSYVPGVEISGTLFGIPGGGKRSKKLSNADFSEVFKLRFRVTGNAAARGNLIFDLRKQKVTGRLGGKRVHARFGFEVLFPTGRRSPSVSAALNCCRFIR
jgi:pimeloyl-ACP methyl ester carboxylesterase